MAREAWSQAELALLSDMSLSLADVAARTGRPYQGVANKAYRLGLRRKGPPSGIDWSDRLQVRTFMRQRYGKDTRSNWTEPELALLHDPSLSRRELALRTGRSRYAVKIKLRRLGLARNKPAAAEAFRGDDWEAVRAVVLERDGYSCQDCGLTDFAARRLVVHHAIPWHLWPSNDLTWVVTLCRRCHGKRPEHMWHEIPDEVIHLLIRGEEVMT